MAYVDGTLSVTTIPVTATLSAAGKTCDGTTAVAPGSLSCALTGVLAHTAGSALAGSLTRDAGEAVGSYPIRQGTLAASANYTMTFTTGTLTIGCNTCLLPPADRGDRRSAAARREIPGAVAAGDDGWPVLLQPDGPPVRHPSRFAVQVSGGSRRHADRGGRPEWYAVPTRHVAMNSNKTRDTAPIQSLDRGLAILEAVAVSPVPVPLKQLTDLIGIDRSSVCRLANTLRRRRFLANPAGSKDYILGPTAWRLSRKYGRTPLGTFFHEHLRALTSRVGETSHIAVREGAQALFVDHHTPNGHVVTVAGQTGEFVPLHCTAHGKALVSDMDLDALKALLGSAPLHAHTRNTIVSLPKLAKVCAEVRASGYALDDREHLDDVRCIAAPIRDAQGDIVASVGISAPLTRLPRGRIVKATAEVVAAARAIAASLDA